VKLTTLPGDILLGSFLCFLGVFCYLVLDLCTHAGCCSVRSLCSSKESLTGSVRGIRTLDGAVGLTLSDLYHLDCAVPKCRVGGSEARSEANFFSTPLQNS